MATGLVTSWGGTITDIGPMYPFVGTEMLLVLVGVAFWIAWHVIQTRQETQQLQDDVEKLKNPETSRNAIARDS